MNPPRLAPVVVLDTSVLFSYLHSNHRRFAVRDAVSSGLLMAAVCDSTLAELVDVGLRFHDQAKVDAFAAELLQKAVRFPEPAVRFALHSDPKDSIFINLAIASHADFLVTYDKAYVSCRFARTSSRRQDGVFVCVAS